MYKLNKMIFEFLILTEWEWNRKQIQKTNNKLVDLQKRQEYLNDLVNKID